MSVVRSLHQKNKRYGHQCQDRDLYWVVTSMSEISDFSMVSDTG